MIVCQVSVVRKRHAALYVVNNKRLRVAAGIRAGRSIAYMTNGYLSHAKLAQCFVCKNVIHKTNVMMAGNYAIVVNGNAAAFLSAVL